MAAAVSARLTASAGRRFAFTLGPAFLALAALAWWRWGAVPARVLLTLAVSLMLAGLVAPTRLGPIERGWMSLGAAISKLTTPLVLGLTYLLVFGLVGLLMRATGRNPLARPRNAASFWASREDSPPGPLTRQF